MFHVTLEGECILYVVCMCLDDAERIKPGSRYHCTDLNNLGCQ